MLHYEADLFTSSWKWVDFLLPLAVVWFPTLWSPLCEQFALPWCGESRRKVESLHETHASWHFLSECLCFLIKMLTERNTKTCFVLGATTNEGDYQWLWNVSMLITVSVQEDTKLPWVGDCLFWSCSLLWQEGWHSLFTRLVYNHCLLFIVIISAFKDDTSCYF